MRSGAPATIEDVATHAGVSAATVSRALRGLPNVATTTRRRVERAALALDYHPDPHAARLATGRSLTVGVAVPLLGTWYFSQVIAGAEAVLSDGGYDLLVTTLGTGVERHRFVENWRQFRKRVDGMLLVDLQLDADEVDALASSGARIVTVGACHDAFPSVSIDNRAAARAAVGHLLDLGHTRVALMGEVKGGGIDFEVPRDRRAGYLEALATRGLAPVSRYDVPGDFSAEGGMAAMRRLLSLREPPTAVFAMSDEMAIGALRTLHDRQVDVPGDVSVVGFDDHELAAMVGLTTVHQPVADLGTRAARLLLDAIDGSPAPPDAHLVLPTRLVRRGTCASLTTAR